MTVRSSKFVHFITFWKHLKDLVENNLPIFMEDSVARLAGVGGGRADFCSSAIAKLQGCNECRKCRSIFLPCIALIHAIHGNQ